MRNYKFRKAGYNSINLRLGHSILEIHSPKEIVNDGNKD